MTTNEGTSNNPHYDRRPAETWLHRGATLPHSLHYASRFKQPAVFEPPRNPALHEDDSLAA